LFRCFICQNSQLLSLRHEEGEVIDEENIRQGLDEKERLLLVLITYWWSSFPSCSLSHLHLLLICCARNCCEIRTASFMCPLAFDLMSLLFFFLLMFLVFHVTLKSRRRDSRCHVLRNALQTQSCLGQWIALQITSVPGSDAEHLDWMTWTWMDPLVFVIFWWW